MDTSISSDNLSTNARTKMYQLVFKVHPCSCPLYFFIYFLFCFCLICSHRLTQQPLQKQQWLLLHTSLMVPVCHGFGGKVPSYGEWKAGHQGEELYCIYLGACVEKFSWRSGSLCVRLGTTVCQSVPT